MPYLNEAGLARYNSLLRPWIAGQTPRNVPSTLFNFEQTAKAGAVTCWPVGGTPLAPVVDYIFTETPPANGQPKAPDNPSTITGVSSVNLWLAGKNVNRTIPYYGFTDGVKVNREVTFTANQDGSVTANGTATGGDAVCSLLNTNNVTNYGTSIGVGTWKLSGCPSGGSNSTYAVQPILSTGYGSISYDYGSGGSIVVTKPGAGVGIILRVASGYNAQNLVFRPQIELGTTATSYEQPVEKQKFTLPLGGTFYGGTLDVASGVMTVTWAKYVFDGAFGFNYSSSYANDTSAGFYLSNSSLINNGIDIAPITNSISCDFFPVVTSSNFYTTDESVYKASGASLMFRVNNDRLSSYGYVYGSSTASESSVAFRQWMADNPVTLVYNLATPYTVNLSPVSISALVQTDKYTPRLNTVYTDAQAVQVGYVKSPIRNEFELQQAVTALGGNI